MPNGLFTIGDLKRTGKLLELGCLAYGRHLFVDPAAVGLSDSFPVPALAVRLVCSGCGAFNQPNRHPIWARPDPRRVPGRCRGQRSNGERLFWPVDSPGDAPGVTVLV